MKLYHISDQHGNDKEYFKIIEKIKEPDISILGGDCGVGFVTRFSGGQIITRNFPSIPKNHFVTTGNHDSRQHARKHPNFIADVKYLKKYDIFVVPGAESPAFDRKRRKSGFDWFSDEELSQHELDMAYDRYVKIKPKILYSHEAPEWIRVHIFSVDNPTRTSITLQKMLNTHRPKIHIFNHWHKWIDREIDGVRFICRPELGVVEIDLDTL